jgi:Dullard-like phosphatase family protein
VIDVVVACCNNRKCHWAPPLQFSRVKFSFANHERKPLKVLSVRNGLWTSSTTGLNMRGRRTGWPRQFRNEIVRSRSFNTSALSTPTSGLLLLGKHSCLSHDGATAAADSLPRPHKTRRSDDQGVSDRHNRRPKPATTTKTTRNSPAVVAVKRKYKTYTSDLIVVLDLDECLIHAEMFNDPFMASSYAHQVQNTATKKTSVTATSGPVESFRVQVNRKCYAHVNLRPGVLDFLQHITSRYETHIYTAATRVYADAVLDYLVARLGCHSSSSSSGSSDDLFAGRWYRQHCAHDVARGAYVKDLSRLPVPLHRTVLVDNNPLSFLSQPQNGILVNAFYDDGDDRTLKTVARFIATYLAPAAVDVRAVLVYGPCPMETFASHKNKQSVLASEELLN